MQDELFIVSSIHHLLAKKKDVTMADLQDQLWVTREIGSGTGQYLNHVIRSNGLRVKSLLTISSNQGIKETLMNGMGLSLLSHSVIERDVEHGNLSIIKLKSHLFTRTLSYIYSPIMQDKRNVKIFIDMLNQKWPNLT
jgi:DNA-binding transcriptional LysR family regulator